MELEQLLNQIAIWANREQTVRHEKYKRGESFNIFKACGVDSYEVTHSSIIAEFLNPLGSHGQGTLFLEAFMDSLNFEDFDFAINNITVKPEMVIPNGRLDIIISNGNKQAVIIENKIYAQDQWKQLKKYDDYAKTKYPNGYRILYLTLDGHLPNDEASQAIDYILVSYKYHIVKWLTQCKFLAIDKPIIRETLHQYILHIKELTNSIDMDMTNKDEMVKVLVANYATTAQIFNLKDNIEKYILEEYIFPALREIAAEYDLTFESDEDFYSKSTYNGFVMLPNNPTPWHICFEFGKRGWGQLGVGVVWNKNQRNQRKAIKRLNIFNYGPNDIWFYGWKYVENRDWDIDYLLKAANDIAGFRQYYANLVSEIVDAVKSENLQ